MRSINVMWASIQLFVVCIQVITYANFSANLMVSARCFHVYNLNKIHKLDVWHTYFTCPFNAANIHISTVKNRIYSCFFGGFCAFIAFTSTKRKKFSLHFECCRWFFWQCYFCLLIWPDKLELNHTSDNFIINSW